MSAREAHGSRVPGLPRQHVLRSARTRFPSQRQRDDVREAGQVTNEREQRQRVRVFGGAMHDRSVAAFPEAVREPLEVVPRQPRREVAVERDVARQRAQGPERLEVELGRELDELVRLGRRRALLGIDDHELALGRPRRTIEPQARKQPGICGDRVRAPGNDQFGPVADVAEAGGAYPEGLSGGAGGVRRVDHGAERVGESDGGALALAVGPPETAHER
jgi:hypothetical protein